MTRMQVRIECTAPGLEGNWVGLADMWTRGELREWLLAALGGRPQEVQFDLLRKKLLEVHVYLPDGSLLTDGAALVERFDDLDVRVVRWLASGVSGALEELQSLGKARKRLLFDGVEVAAMTMETPKR